MFYDHPNQLWISLILLIQLQLQVKEDQFISSTDLPKLFQNNRLIDRHVH